MNAPIRPPTLRERQKTATHALILEAVGRCMQDRGLEELNFAEVAAEAGVGLRTVYRYFPTKDLLLDAFWSWLHASLGIDAFPETARELVALPAKVFPMFDAQEAVIRGMMASRQGRDVRMRVNDKRQAAIRKSVIDGAGELPEPELSRVCAACQLLYSATAWFTMKDYWGMSGEEAGKAAGEAIQALIDTAKAKRESQP